MKRANRDMLLMILAVIVVISGCGLEQGLEYNKVLEEECELIGVSSYSAASGAHVHTIYKCPGIVVERIEK